MTATESARKPAMADATIKPDQMENHKTPEPGVSASNPLQLRAIFKCYHRKLLVTYGLFNLENMLRLAQPFVIGLAINGLLTGSWVGVYVLMAQHLMHLLVGTFRQMYDTRAFSAIYTSVASELVTRQRADDIETSRVAARSALSRDYVDFFERSVPLVMRAGYSVIGALVMMFIYDWRLAPLCLALLLPALWLNRRYSRKTFKLSTGLHDELEREVDVIGAGDSAGVAAHYQQVARWRIRLSDAEAINFAAMEIFILGVLVAALAIVCQGTFAAGDIFAIFRYLLMFLMGLDTVPRVVQQLSRLRDIHQRVGLQKPPGKRRR